MLRISRGVGRSDFWPFAPLSEAVSSRIMSLHSSMHSSQMNTEGPAISLRTSCWLLPQKEQYRSFSPLAFSDIAVFSQFSCVYPTISGAAAPNADTVALACSCFNARQQHAVY